MTARERDSNGGGVCVSQDFSPEMEVEEVGAGEGVLSNRKGYMAAGLEGCGYWKGNGAAAAVVGGNELRFSPAGWSEAALKFGGTLTLISEGG